jgi:hypothetical protein
LRDYAQIRPRFWIQGTGRRFRGDHEARELALYLMSAPTSNLIGLYYLPMTTIAYELGYTLEQASGVMKRVCAPDQDGDHFARYDAVTEYVWVVNMAREQVGDAPSRKDKRVTGVKNELKKHAKSVFAGQFTSHYSDLFGLENTPNTQAPSKPLASPFQGVTPNAATPSQGSTTQAATPSISGSGSGSGTGYSALRTDDRVQPSGLEPETQHGEPEREERTAETVRRLFDAAVVKATTNPPAKGKSYREHVTTLAGWLDERGGDVGKIFTRVLQGFMRDERAAQEGFPLAWLAQNPGKYLSAAPGTAQAPKTTSLEDLRPRKANPGVDA